MAYDANIGNKGRHRRPALRGFLKQTASAAVLCGVAAVAFQQPAAADSDINAGSTYQSSGLGSSVNPVFNGGTLQISGTNTISKNFTVKDVSTNTIDINGKAVTMSGVFSGAGPLTIVDSAGGGALTFSNSGNSYTGITTINSGATFALTDTGAISTSSKLVDNGTFDLTNLTSTTSIISLEGSGTVALGARYLTVTDAAGTFSGVISGTGGFAIAGGTETLTGVSTLTGSVSVTAGTLVLSGSGNLAAASGVSVGGTLDVTAVPNVHLTSLSGSGSVLLGAQNLTLTNASGIFAGVISGTGNFVLAGGTEFLAGNNTFTGSITVSAGTLYVGSSSITNNIINNATFGFDSASTIAMSGVISGTGAVTQTAGGITTISTVQTYTGPTTITSGRVALSGAGSIATSSSVTANGTFDITATTAGASITSLAGDGYVYLGTQTLTLTNASGIFSGTISGEGNVILAGGAQALSGTNSYTGTTTVSGGTLVLPSGSSLTSSSVIDNAALDISVSSTSVNLTSATIVSLAGNGTVALGEHTLILTNANDTFAGVISGTGGLTINAGTETLSGANTYTGTTTIAGGSLVLGSTGGLATTSTVATNGTFDISGVSGTSISLASLAGTGTVKLGAVSLNLLNASGAFSGAIQGTGGLTVSGGTQILSGNNTYTGGTTVNAGATLQVGDRNKAGSLVGDITNNGVLAFNRADTSVYAGVVSGTGALRQTGSGTTILTGANTYTGGTTITNGTLQLGNNGTTGSLLGDVTDNGTLAFGRSDATVFGAIVSGTGGVTQVYGTTALTAVNTYTGSTTVNSGATLALGGSGSVASSKGVTANGTFDVSAATLAPQIASLAGSGTVILGSQSLTLTNANGAFSGAISGTGGLTLNQGTQTLSGINTYTGLTTVHGGTLTVNGSTTASSGLTVGSGGKLAGTGTVSALTVASGATVAPGTTGPGTLAVNGSVTFSSGSSFLVNVASTAASKLTATGTASLAGTFNVATASGTYLLGQKFTVLTANGGVSGTFALAQITGSDAKFSSVLSYDANNVYLQINLAQLSPLLPANATANQAHVIGAVDAAIAAGKTLPSELENLGNLTSTALATDASQLSGEIGADVPRAGAALFDTFLNAIFDHIADSRPAGPASMRGPVQYEAQAWLTGFGGTSLASGDPTVIGSHKLRSDQSGLVGGASWTLSPKLTLGAALSAGFSNFHLVDASGTGKVTALQAAAYGYAEYSPHFYGSFAGAVALDNISTNRTMTVSGTDTLHGKLTAVVLGGRYETGITLPWFAPYVAIQDQLALLPAYSETASSGSGTFALRYAKRTINEASVELGIRQSVDIEFTPRWILTPNGTLRLSDRVAWAHNFTDDPDGKASFVALPSSDFAIEHAKASMDAALVTLGADVKFEGGYHAGVHLEGDVSAKSQRFTGMAEFGFAW